MLRRSPFYESGLFNCNCLRQVGHLKVPFLKTKKGLCQRRERLKNNAVALLPRTILVPTVWRIWTLCFQMMSINFRGIISDPDDKIFSRIFYSAVQRWGWKLILTEERYCFRGSTDFSVLPRMRKIVSVLTFDFSSSKFNYYEYCSLFLHFWSVN